MGDCDVVQQAWTVSPLFHCALRGGRASVPLASCLCFCLRSSVYVVLAQHPSVSQMLILAELSGFVGWTAVY